MSPITDERRAHKRHLVKLRVAVRDEGKLRELHATDLSRGGLFVATPRALPVGERVGVKLVHPLSGEVFEIDAVVANVRCARGGEVQGCGLRFELFDDEARGALSRFVAGVLDPDVDEADAEAPTGEPPESPEGEDAREAPPSAATTEALRAHALMLRGLALSRQGNLVGAAHLLVRAVSLAPEEEALWKVLRQLEARLEAAAAEREGGAPRRPSGPDASAGGDRPDGSPARPSSHPGARKARLLFDEARRLYQAGDFDGAAESLERAIEADPDHGPALYALAGLLAEHGDELPRALDLCRRAVALDPENVDYRDALRSLEELTI